MHLKNARNFLLDLRHYNWVLGKTKNCSKSNCKTALFTYGIVVASVPVVLGLDSDERIVAGDDDLLFYPSSDGSVPCFLTALD